MKETVSYDSAFSELQEILQELEDGEISLDLLSKKVKRAHELIGICQKKFKEVEEEVANILKEIEQEESSDNT